MTDENNERAIELWNRFRFHIVLGLALVLAAIGGFTYRHNAHEEEKIRANAELFALLAAAEEQQAEEAVAAYGALEDARALPELAHLGAFALSSLYVDGGEAELARPLLRAAVEGSADVGVRRLAALRLAELLVNLGEFDEAAALLADYKPESGRLRILFEERAGDVAFARGDIAAAKAAYYSAAALARRRAEFYLPVIRFKLGAALSRERGAAVAGVAGDSAAAEDSGDAQ